MNIKVSQPELNKCISFVMNTLKPGDESLMGHILFQAEKGEIYMSSYHNRAHSKILLDCTIGDDVGAGSFTVDGKRLRQWVGAVGAVDISISCEKDVVVASTSKSKAKFASLDPSRFPDWEEVFKEAKEKPFRTTDRTTPLKISASQLAKALEFSKPFVSENEAVKPEMAQIAVQDGVVFAGRTGAISAVTLKGEQGESLLKDSSFRIHVRDLSVAIKGLNSLKEQEITLLEHPSELFCLGDNKSSFGLGDTGRDFPVLNMATNDDNMDVFFEVSVSDLRSHILQLTASAKDGEKNIHFVWSDGVLYTGMPSIFGELAKIPIETTEVSNLDQLPENGVQILFSYILHFATKFKLDKMKFKFQPRNKKQGLVYLKHQDTDVYSVLLMYSGS